MEISIKTTKKDEVVDITNHIEEHIRKEEIEDGICSVFVKHTTCSITTADLDPGTDEDLLSFIRKISPDISYRHPHDPSHASDHLLSSIIGPSLSIPIKDGRLSLGTWQRVILVELSGPRKRSLEITFIPYE